MHDNKWGVPSKQTIYDRHSPLKRTTKIGYNRLKTHSYCLNFKKYSVHASARFHAAFKWLIRLLLLLTVDKKNYTCNHSADKAHSGYRDLAGNVPPHRRMMQPRNNPIGVIHCGIVLMICNWLISSIRKMKWWYIPQSIRPVNESSKKKNFLLMHTRHALWNRERAMFGTWTITTQSRVASAVNWIFETTILFCFFIHSVRTHNHGVRNNGSSTLYIIVVVFDVDRQWSGDNTHNNKKAMSNNDKEKYPEEARNRISQILIWSFVLSIALIDCNWRTRTFSLHCHDWHTNLAPMHAHDKQKLRKNISLTCRTVVGSCSMIHRRLCTHRRQYIYSTLVLLYNSRTSHTHHTHEHTHIHKRTLTHVSLCDRKH